MQPILRRSNGIGFGGLKMDIVIGQSTGVKRDGSQNKISYRNAAKKKKVDRRKNKQDRRKSVREGVFVTLSTKKDRRIHADRRKNHSYPKYE